MVIGNKKAYFNYDIRDKYEAGISLVGCEVKSIRNGHMTIHESYIRIKDGEAYLINANILPYEQGNRYNHVPNRDRKLLLHRREIQKIQQRIERQSLVAVPLQIFFKKKRFKGVIGIGMPQKKKDKRATIKEREIKRSMDRAAKQRV